MLILLLLTVFYVLRCHSLDVQNSAYSVKVSLSISKENPEGCIFLQLSGFLFCRFSLTQGDLSRF